MPEHVLSALNPSAGSPSPLPAVSAVSVPPCSSLAETEARFPLHYADWALRLPVHFAWPKRPELCSRVDVARRLALAAAGDLMRPRRNVNHKKSFSSDCNHRNSTKLRYGRKHFPGGSIGLAISSHSQPSGSTRERSRKR